MDLRIADYALDGRTHVIEVTGQLDLYTAPSFKQRIVAVLEQGTTKLIIDLAGVTFIDSEALSVLISALRRMRALDGRLSLVVTDYDIERLFAITGLDTTFAIFRSRDAALEDLTGAPRPVSES